MSLSGTTQDTNEQSRSSLLPLSNEHSVPDSRTDEKSFSRIHRWFTRYADSWWPEMLSIIFSLTATTAISVILMAFNGSIAPHIFMGLTLNAIISILATASRAALLFAISNALGQTKWIWLSGEWPKTLDVAETLDSASRGPLGSLQILLATGRLSSASIGATLTILALALDPFVQQLVVYEAGLNYQPSSDVQVAQVYTWASRKDPFMSYTKALNAAIWTNELELPVHCASANCTWDSFRSLHVFHECRATEWSFTDICNLDFYTKDIERMVYNRTSGSGTEAANYYFTSFNCTARSSTNDTFEVPIQVRAYTNVSNNNALQFHISAFPSFQIIRLIRNKGYQWGGWPYGGPKEPSSTPLPLITFVQLGFQNESITTTTSGVNETRHVLRISEATECSLDLGLGDRQVTVINGKVQTNVTNRTQGKKTAYTLPSGDPLECWVPLTTPIEALSELSYDQLIAGSKKDFWFCTQGPQNTLFVKTLEQSLTGSRLVDYTRNIRNESFFSEVNEDSLKATVQAVYRNGFRTSIERITQSMSNSMAQLDGDVTLIEGMSGRNISIVRIRWTWLALPILLNFGSIIFLLLVSAFSYNGNVPLWKSSVNALLYHGFEAPPTSQGSLRSVADMNDKASQTTVGLRHSSHLDRLALRPASFRRRSSRVKPAQHSRSGIVIQRTSADMRETDHQHHTALTDSHTQK